MKRTLSVVLALMLVLACVSAIAEFELPIVEENLTLTCFMETDVKWSATKNSVADVGSYQVIMDKTNITIDFNHPAAGQQKEKFDTMMATGKNLPDMIYYNWASVTGGAAKYIEDGTILPLNDYLEEWAPNFLAYMEKYPEIRKQTVLDDGTYYMFPMIRLDEESGVGTWFKTEGFMIRQDWLDALELDMPTTVDELHDVLVAFKNGNLNGDGEELFPLVLTKDYVISKTAAMYGILNDFYCDNGEIKYGPMQEKFKDYLSTMNQWYEEGLIDPEFLTIDGTTLTSKVTSNKAGVTFYQLAGGMGTWSNMMAGDENFNIVAMPWIKQDADSPAYTATGDYNKVVVGPGVAITSAALENGHLEACIKFRDYFYSPEGTLISNFGIEGESYTMVDGEPIFTDAVLANDKGLTTTQALSQYALSASNDAMVKTAKYFKQVTLLLDNQKASQPVWNDCDMSLLLPPIAHTADESSRVSVIMSEINTYVDTAVYDFISGRKPIDEFDAFVAEIENMNIEEAIEIKQAAYDRYESR